MYSEGLWKYLSKNNPQIYVGTAMIDWGVNDVGLLQIQESRIQT